MSTRRAFVSSVNFDTLGTPQGYAVRRAVATSRASRYGSRDMTREAWLEAREGAPGEVTLGGSDIATILGWNPYEDPIGLYGRKRGLIERDDEDSEAAQAGRFLEEGILRWYAKRTGRKLVDPAQVASVLKLGEDVPLTTRGALQRDGGTGFGPALALKGSLDVHWFDPLSGQPPIFRSKSEPWRLLTPDAFAFDEAMGWGIIDAKNLHASKAADWAEGVPPDKAPQVAYYTQPTPFLWGGFAVVFGGQRLVSYDIRREDMAPIFELIDEEVPDFLRHVEIGEEPRAEPSRKSLAALKRLYPSPRKGKTVAWVSGFAMADGSVVDPEDFDVEYLEVKSQCREWNDRRDQLQATLRAVAKDAEFVRMRGGVAYRFTTSESGRQSIRRSRR